MQPGKYKWSGSAWVCRSEGCTRKTFTAWVPADPARRRPQVFRKSAPVIVCDVCDFGRDPDSGFVWHLYRTTPALRPPDVESM